jgi:small subunit ribosomal protein S16
MIKLRLKRYGGKKQSCYRIVAMDSRTKRDGASIEELGYYNPRTKQTYLKTEKILTFLNHGGKPTKTVYDIFCRAKLYGLTSFVKQTP